MSASRALTVVGQTRPVMSPMQRHAHNYVTGRRQRAEITPATAKRQTVILGGFADTYGQRPVERLNRRDVERWAATRSTLAPGTRRQEWTVLRGFTRWLTRERHVRRDPMLDMRAPKVPRSVPRALSVAECDAIAAVLPDTRARAIFALMRRCGLRRQEVIDLQIGDWDRHSQALTVRGKGGHVRLIPVPVDVALVLEEQAAGAPSGPMIRRYDTGGPISNAWLGRLMQDWMTQAGVKRAAHDGRGCHSLRHTIASEVAERTHDLPLVQGLLGHASLTSTQVYIRRVELAAMRRALELPGTPDEPQAA